MSVKWLKTWSLLGLSASLAAGVSGEEMNGFDLSGATIPVEEIHRGGPPRDGIPSIDQPKFEEVEAAGKWLREDDRVVSVEVDGEVRAYPLRILVWHEIVNDRFGDRGVAVTYCPLCGTAMVFESEAGGRDRTFGVSGLLYNSDVLMYDRETESLWSQLAMEAVSGPAAGETLELMGGVLQTWESWRREHPRGRVLSRDTGASRNYGRTPYRDYERTDRLMFPARIYREELSTKTWIAGVRVEGRTAAFPIEDLESHGAVKAQIGDTVIEVDYDPERDLVMVTDEETGEPIPVTRAYWFAWQAFYPETALWEKPED